jgi:hypothetical protein
MSVYDMIPSYGNVDSQLKALGQSRSGSDPYRKGYSQLSEAQARGAIENVYSQYGMKASASSSLASMGIPDYLANAVMDNPSSLFELDRSLAAQKAADDARRAAQRQMQKNLDRLKAATSLLQMPLTDAIRDTQGQEVLDAVTGASKPSGSALVKTTPEGLDDPSTARKGLSGFGSKKGLINLFKQLIEEQKILGN